MVTIITHRYAARARASPDSPPSSSQLIHFLIHDIREGGVAARQCGCSPPPCAFAPYISIVVMLLFGAYVMNYLYTCTV